MRFVLLQGLEFVARIVAQQDSEFTAAASVRKLILQPPASGQLRCGSRRTDRPIIE
jgi:hypothetical protein